MCVLFAKECITVVPPSYYMTLQLSQLLSAPAIKDVPPLDEKSPPALLKCTWPRTGECEGGRVAALAE